MKLMMLVNLAPVEMANGITRTSQELALVEVDRVKMERGHYYARLVNPERDAKHDENELYGNFRTWKHFKKSNNKHLGIPVMQKGWVLSV